MRPMKLAVTMLCLAGLGFGCANLAEDEFGVVRAATTYTSTAETDTSYGAVGTGRVILNPNGAEGLDKVLNSGEMSKSLGGDADHDETRLALIADGLPTNGYADLTNGSSTGYVAVPE